MDGYIKLHRSMLDWEWMDDPVTVQVWIYCLLRANYTAQRWHGEILQPGQFITSIGNMSEDLGISPRRLRTALNHLKATSNVTSKATNKWTLVTVEKWALYQSAGEKATSKATSGLTNNRQATDKQPTTDKERKEREEGKKREINKEKPNQQGAFAGTAYRDPVKYSADESREITSSSRGAFAPIKAALMRKELS